MKTIAILHSISSMRKPGTLIHNHAAAGGDLYIPRDIWSSIRYSWSRSGRSSNFSGSYWRGNLKNIVGFIPVGFCFYAYFVVARPVKRAVLVTVVRGAATEPDHRSPPGLPSNARFRHDRSHHQHAWNLCGCAVLHRNLSCPGEEIPVVGLVSAALVIVYGSAAWIELEVPDCVAHGDRNRCDRAQHRLARGHHTLESERNRHRELACQRLARRCFGTRRRRRTHVDRELRSGHGESRG